MKNIKALIFDMDGTLFDTHPLYLQALETALKSYNIDFEQNDLMNIILTSWDNIQEWVTQKVGGENIAEFIARTIQIYEGILKAQGTPLKKGVKELIGYAKDNDYRVAIGTNSTQILTKMNIEYSPLKLDDFDVIFTTEMVFKPKPDKEMYQKVCEELGFDCGQCLVLEDSRGGATAGIDAGCMVAIIPSIKYRDSEFDKKVDLKLHNLLEVIDFLESR